MLILFIFIVVVALWAIIHFGSKLGKEGKQDIKDTKLARQEALRRHRQEQEQARQQAITDRNF